MCGDLVRPLFGSKCITQVLSTHLKGATLKIPWPMATKYEDGMATKHKTSKKSTGSPEYTDVPKIFHSYVWHK